MEKVKLYDAIDAWCNGTPFLDISIGETGMLFQGESLELPLALVEYCEKTHHNNIRLFVDDLAAALSTLRERSSDQIEWPNTFKIFELLVKLSSLIREPRLLQPVATLLEERFLEHLKNWKLSEMLAESIFRCTYLTVYDTVMAVKRKPRNDLKPAPRIVVRLAEKGYLNKLHSVAAFFILTVCDATKIERNLRLISRIDDPESFSLPSSMPEKQAMLFKSCMATPDKVATTTPVLQRLGYTKLQGQLFPSQSTVKTEFYRIVATTDTNTLRAKTSSRNEKHEYA